jgi:hypothetical protein
MAKRPSPRTQDTIVAMCEDGRRRSSVFLSSTIPERTTRQVVGHEPHFSVSQIGDIHLIRWTFRSLSPYLDFGPFYLVDCIPSTMKAR